MLVLYQKDAYCQNKVTFFICFQNQLVTVDSSFSRLVKITNFF